MARVEINEIVLTTGSGTGGAVSVVKGASVQVNIRSAGAATVYAAQVGGTTLTNPLTTDGAGRINGWVDQGSYDLLVTATGMQSYLQPYEAAADGLQGVQGPAGVGAVWKGVWSSVTTYALGDGVYRLGRPYISNVASNLNHDPSTDNGTNWGALFTSLAGIYDITAAPYNATTAATDNTTAIQAAITDAKTNGGSVYVPPGVFKYASPLNCDLPSKGFSIVGPQLAYGELATVPSELRYTGTTSPAISCHSVYNFGLRGLRFTYDNAGFTGDIVDIDGGPHAADCTNWSIEKCSSRHINTITARSIIRLSQAINGIIRDCGLAGATNSIRFADSGGPYVVGVKVDNCTFNNNSNAHILVGTSGGEDNVIEFCRFEAGNNTTAIRGTTIAVDGGGSDNAQYSFAVRDCWFGDAGAATTWIKNVISQSNQYPCVISGNRFASTQAGTHLTLKGRWKVEDNSFEGGTVYDSIGGDLLNLVAICNYYNTPTALFNATRFTAGYPQNDYVSLGNSGAENTIDNRIGITATSGTFGTLGTAPGDLLIGARTNAGYETGDGRARVYYGKPTGLTRPALILQAPDDATDGNVVIVTGASAAPVVWAQRTKLGFYATVPVARPTTYTVHAGTGSRDLPVGATLVQVEQALRQLLKDLGQTSGNGLLQADA